jgi:2,3-bisphosphoglycerate-dependent phosphoglycerate mutase
MQVKIERVSFDDKPVFFQLMQLYLYDSSEYDGWELTEHGYFRYGYIDQYWTEEGRHPFFIRANGRLAGLAMVRTGSDADAGQAYYSMAEFFVMRKFRGKGIGKQAATMLLDIFPGSWHVGETNANKPAQAFWRKLVREYTSGNYKEEVLPDEDFPWMSGPVQKFASTGKTLVYLVRHAQSANTPDERNRPLTEQGLRDSNMLARFLKFDYDAVYSSPYRRAIQTVEPLASRAGKSIQLVEDLRERNLAAGEVDFDEAALRTWKDFNHAYPGGESNLEAQTRGVAALELLMQVNRGKHIVVSTHGTLMSLIMNRYSPKEYDYKFWQKLDMPDVYLLVFADMDYSWSTHLWK